MKIVILAISLAMLVQPALANSWITYKDIEFDIWLGSFLGIDTDQKEKSEYSINEFFYQGEQAKAKVQAIGVPTIDTVSTVATFATGVNTTLAFNWVDPATGAVTSGPTIGSVSYEFLDPSNFGNFILIGSSSNALTDFALPYTIPSFEPLILAIPYDSSGQAIVITGVDGDNDAPGFVVDIPGLATPEPSSMILLGTGILGMTGRLRRRLIW